MNNSESIEIWHIEGRRSFRVVWLCEELAIPYTLKFVKGDVLGSLLGIRAAYPKMPVAPTVRMYGQWIVESGAIFDVLLAREGGGNLIPAVDSSDYLLHAQWMHFAEGSAVARMLSERFVALALKMNMDGLPEGYRAGREPVAALSVEAAQSPLNFVVGSRGVFDFAEDHLAAHTYFGGAEFTAADIMMHWAVQVSGLMSWIDLDQYPAIQRWRERVEDRSAFKRALAAALPGGGDSYGQPLGVPHPFPARPPKRAAELN